jgi:hypothetical protein
VTTANEGQIAVHPLARRARPWLPAVTREARIFVGPSGEALISRADGTVDRVVQGGRPHGGVAEDEAAEHQGR